MTKILILEHSKSVRNNLCERLEFEGFTTRAVDTAAAAEVIASQEPYDLMITDDVEPLVDIDIPLIVISSRPNFELAVEAIHRGAVDFLTKPIDMNRLLASIRGNVSESVSDGINRVSRRANRPKKSVSEVAIEPIVGESEEIVYVRHLIDKVAPSQARVLITGEYLSDSLAAASIADWSISTP